MSPHRLTATVRQPPFSDEDTEGMVQDVVVVDLPNNFGFTWPTERPYGAVRTSPNSERVNFHSDGDISESELMSPTSTQDAGDSPEATNTPTRCDEKQIPTFSRALSMPLPAQLEPLQNPHRIPTPPHANDKCPNFSAPTLSPFHELSVELADCVQMIIQTMLQVSPAQILDPAKEQFSACSLSVPTPSMSAMFTTLKNLNYISANMEAFLEPSGSSKHTACNPQNDFDVGEVLQSVGDALSGAASRAGVDLVIFHGDVGMKHTSVTGNENGLSFALIHIIRQVLNTTRPGDSIELGLFLRSVLPEPFGMSELDGSGAPIASPVDIDGPLQCTFQISHKFGASEPSTPDGDTQSPSRSRNDPNFSANLLRCLLDQVGASLTTGLHPKTFPVGRACELTTTLRRGAPFPSKTVDSTIDDEPTLEELAIFAESLRGKKVTLYASSKGSFAHHLTSYLTVWGLDVSHISSEGEVDDSSSSETTNATTTVDGFPAGANATPKIEARPSGPQPLSFIFIDDDVDVLRDRLQALRVEQPYQNATPRKRPSLAAYHRPLSSTHVTRALGHPTHLPLPPSPVVIVHFTSISNYKVIKDCIQSILNSYSGSMTPVPEVIVLPKPAGPRRFLTALHTAVKKPIVDPFFSPIATSPASPGINGGNFFLSANVSTPTPKSPANGRPPGTRTNSDRSTRSTTKDVMEHPNIPPPSPLGMPDNIEYFSEASLKLGSSPSSGLVIQSPDGQPTGIVFQPPRGKNPSKLSPPDREKAQSSGSEFRGSSRRTPDADGGSRTHSFSSLHNASQSPKPSIILDTEILRGTSAASSPGARARRLTITEDRRMSPSDTGPQTGPLLASSPGASGALSPRKAQNRRLPAESKAPTPPPPKKSKLFSDANVVPPISVLIVDDNPINQTILSTFMSKKKIKFDVAKNGQEAVDKWRTGDFHLILMDIQMPIKDGIQATKEIRQLEKESASAGYPPPTPRSELQRTPVRTPSDTSESRSNASPYRSSVIIVALTASSLQSDRVAALAAGCNDFLTKPVSLLWLNNKIIEWGSIKALQMWAEFRPEATRTITAQARSVADRLHVPPGRTTPSPSRSSSAVRGGNTQTVNAAVATSSATTIRSPQIAQLSPSLASASSSSSSSSTPEIRSGGRSMFQPSLSTPQELAATQNPDEDETDSNTNNLPEASDQDSKSQDLTSEEGSYPPSRSASSDPPETLSRSPSLSNQ